MSRFRTRRTPWSAAGHPATAEAKGFGTYPPPMWQWFYSIQLSTFKSGLLIAIRLAVRKGLRFDPCRAHQLTKSMT